MWIDVVAGETWRYAQSSWVVYVESVASAPVIEQARHLLPSEQNKSLHFSDSLSLRIKFFVLFLSMIVCRSAILSKDNHNASIAHAINPSCLSDLADPCYYLSIVLNSEIINSCTQRIQRGPRSCRPRFIEERIGNFWFVKNQNPHLTHILHKYRPIHKYLRLPRRIFGNSLANSPWFFRRFLRDLSDSGPWQAT